jgi:hypothetical protein
MVFFKFGFTFLAGTAFGAAMSSLRQDRWQHHGPCYHRRGRDIVAGESEMWGREEDGCVKMQERNRGIKCPKEGKKEKRAAKETESD